MRRSWFHFNEWECLHAGMYQTLPPSGSNAEEAANAYRDFLANLDLFDDAMTRVANQWPISCKQFLSNQNINRIAWLGQASMCIETGVPRQFKHGFARLNKTQQDSANSLAKKHLEQWEGLYCSPESESPIEKPPLGLRKRIRHYIETWKLRGYAGGIPDEVPGEIMRLNLAPSYKAITLAIMKNDHHLTSLGYSAPVSSWYGALKKIEIEDRESARQNKQQETNTQLLIHL